MFCFKQADAGSAMRNADAIAILTHINGYRCSGMSLSRKSMQQIILHSKTKTDHLNPHTCMSFDIVEGERHGIVRIFEPGKLAFVYMIS